MTREEAAVAEARARLLALAEAVDRKSPLALARQAPLLALASALLLGYLSSRPSGRRLLDAGLRAALASWPRRT